MSKYKKLFTICFFFFLFFPLASHEFQLYTADSLAVGKISEYTQGTLGHGASFTYEIPDFDLIAVTAKLEHAINILDSYSFATSWNSIIFSLGAQSRFEITDFLNINPGVDFGICVNMLRPKTLTENVYMDPLVQLSCSFVFYNFAVTPFYRVYPEKNNVGQYAGLNLGIIIDID